MTMKPVIARTTKEMVVYSSFIRSTVVGMDRMLCVLHSFNKDKVLDGTTTMTRIERECACVCVCVCVCVCEKERERE